MTSERAALAAAGVARAAGAASHRWHAVNRVGPALGPADAASDVSP